MGFLWCRPGAALLRCIVMSSPLMFSCSRSSQLCQSYFSLPTVFNHGVVAFSIRLLLSWFFFSTLLLALCVLFLSVFSPHVCTHLSILHVPLLFLRPNYYCGCTTNDINSCSESWKFKWFSDRLWINTSGNQLVLFDLAKSKHKSTVIEPYASNRLSQIVLPHVIVMDHSLNQELYSHYEAKSKGTSFIHTLYSAHEE